MNKRIKELAEQAGYYQEQDYDGTRFLAMAEGCWGKFAELVRADEREACAAIADVYARGLERNYSEIIADEIRARGDVK